MNVETPFPIWLKQRRKALDLRQEDLAERIGCSESTIRKFELGQRRPSRQVAELLAECLGVPPDERPAFIDFARGKDSESEQGPAVAAAPAPLIPTSLTPLIGREKEVEEASSFLLHKGVRLLTLTGPPGIGKTRLAIQVVSELVDEFEDGVYFVALAPITDPRLVPTAIAQALGVKEAASRSILASLTHFLRSKQILLMLDNFEQVVKAAPVVSELLSACPRLKALVTSREVLHIQGEQQFPVPPLALPQSAELLNPKDLQTYPAVSLFVQRAQAVEPEFALTAHNAEAVAVICARLEGLPLAIELAAARINLLTPQEIVARLGNRLKLLTGGARDLPPRHQTLRAAIDWSYHLLNRGEQVLLARLGAFVGGCTLSAAEAICNPTGDLPFDTLDGLSSLIEKSLLKRGEVLGESRFMMLEMIREYALERLRESGEVDGIRRLHGEYYLALVEAADLKLRSAEQLVWLGRVEQEHDNLRAALQWSIGEGELEGTDMDSEATGDLQIGLRLASALSWFWHRRGYYSEGRRWLERGLAKADCDIAADDIPGSWASPRTASNGSWPSANSDPTPLDLRAKALHALGMLGWFQGADHAEMRIPLRRSVEIYRQICNKQGLALSLSFLAACFLDDPETARPLTEESVALCREVLASHSEDREAVWNLAEALFSNGRSALTQRDYEAAVSNCTESVRLFKKTGDRWRAAAPILILGRVAYAKGEYATARGHFEESLALLQEAGDRFYSALLLDALALAARAEGDHEESARLTEESLLIWREIGNTSKQAEALHVLGISS